MDDIAFLLKSFRGDYVYYKHLIETYTKYNSDHIPLYVVVPKEDLDLFKVDYKDINVLSENELLKQDKYLYNRKISMGYINQQIIKLSFWEMGLCKNYFCIDSDCYFIKFFHKSDFLKKEDEPYTIVYDDRELMTAPYYYAMYGKNRDRYNRIIKSELEFEEEVNLFSCHGFGILSSKVLRSLKYDFLDAKNLSYRDIIMKAPVEFTWYNYFLQKSNVIRIYPASPLIKAYHTEKQMNEELKRGVTESSLRRYYIGVVINSNFGKTSGYCSLDDVGDLEKETMLRWRKIFK